MSTTADPLIFIVDENEVFASMVYGFLKTHHYKNAKVFTSVEDAITKAKEKPDIIICENLYNNLSGIDFMKGRNSLNKLNKTLQRFNSNIKNTQLNKHMSHALYFVFLAILALTCIILLLAYLFPTTFRL